MKVHVVGSLEARSVSVNQSINQWSVCLCSSTHRCTPALLFPLFSESQRGKEEGKHVESEASLLSLPFSNVHSLNVQQSEIETELALMRSQNNLPSVCRRKSYNCGGYQEDHSKTVVSVKWSRRDWPQSVLTRTPSSMAFPCLD